MSVDRTSARRTAASLLAALTLALPGIAAADGPTLSSSWRSLAASDEIGAALFSGSMRRARVEQPRLEDERRPAPAPDRALQVQAWLSRYGTVVTHPRR